MLYEAVRAWQPVAKVARAAARASTTTSCSAPRHPRKSLPHSNLLHLAAPRSFFVSSYFLLSTFHPLGQRPPRASAREEKVVNRKQTGPRANGRPHLPFTFCHLPCGSPPPALSLPAMSKACSERSRTCRTCRTYRRGPARPELVEWPPKNKKSGPVEEGGGEPSSGSTDPQGRYGTRSLARLAMRFHPFLQHIIRLICDCLPSVTRSTIKAPPGNPKGSGKSQRAGGLWRDSRQGVF
jgi:hypothetical protein